MGGTDDDNVMSALSVWNDEIKDGAAELAEVGEQPTTAQGEKAAQA
jgi:hypothetical protein